MSEPTSQTVSLNDVAIKYIQAVQRLSDIMVIHWGGFRTLNEQTFDELAKSIPGLPATEFRLPFEVAKAEADFTLVKQTLNEVLSLSIIFLEDVRKLSALVAFNAAQFHASGDLASLAAEVNANTAGMNLFARFKQLKESYGIESPFQVNLESFHNIGKFIFQTNGLVVQDEPVSLHLKVVTAPENGENQPRVSNYEHKWSKGERIVLARDEHAAIFTTISLFIGEMLKEVQEFAKRSGLPDESAE
jgi:hypothetical protein